jgi:hypothetical protein
MISDRPRDLMKKGIVLFLISWVTATGMCAVFVDHNLYINRRNGDLILKDRASTSEKFFFSALLGGAYSAANTVLALTALTFCGRKVRD